MKGRPFAPTGETWDAAVAAWKDLHSDSDAHFDKILEVAGEDIQPQVTWGTSPEMVLPIDGILPDPAAMEPGSQRDGVERALAYMGLSGGSAITDIKLDKVFILKSF